jgi:hypothetical protein
MDQRIEQYLAMLQFADHIDHASPTVFPPTQ